MTTNLFPLPVTNRLNGSRSQDGRKLRRNRKRWKAERLFAWMNTFRPHHSLKYYIEDFLSFIELLRSGIQIPMGVDFLVLSSRRRRVSYSVNDYADRVQPNLDQLRPPCGRILAPSQPETVSTFSVCV